ncbi:PSD1 and planctomycete cytochrome C domain-containing protein [Tautonia rosea]|uniref:PSD1 and planctomycete cytochrome C domain-containing protein n=1 Tax=Tautonia rosea TaxID=2728037 RepID=UPI001474E33A|nr:PSD1 and planctomycete cytochrome C domain-containing protein [Tautonia rosea]
MILIARISLPVIADEPNAIEFNRDIRPILSENCFSCHGPDARNRKAGLRLDEEEGAKARLASDGHAVVPGNRDESELIYRVTSDEPEERMPPPAAGKSLTSEQIELLERWISEGAKWEPHWSLTPIKRPETPFVDEPGFVRNPVDHFILAAQRANGLSPTAEADRVTLIRRLSFDLLGLPPSPEDVNQFLNDTEPRAYDRLVDRMLSSPHYGERMAMFWLDLVRYADSVGYHGDQPVSVSPFRDYVIKAFNENKRFDQFTIEQLAGDLLPDATHDQKIASGYNRLGMMSAEGGVQPKEYLAKYAAERVRNVSGAWLGVTIGCAECHDHKFDPWTTRDFYRMEAFFADIQERGLYSGSDFGPSIPVPTDEQALALAELDTKLARVGSILDTPTPELEAAQLDWEASVAPSIDWKTLTPIEAISAKGAVLNVLEDGSVLASGESPSQDIYTIRATTPSSLTGVVALRVEALPDDSLPARGPGRAENGNFVLTELTVALQRLPDSTLQPLVLEHATATFEQTEGAENNSEKTWSATFAIDQDTQQPGLGWAILGETGLPNQAIFETAIDLTLREDSVLTVTLAQNHENPQHTLGHFRLSVATVPRPVIAPGRGLPRPVRDALVVEPSRRDDDQYAVLSAYYRSIAPALEPQRAELAALQAERAHLNGQVTTMLATVSVPPRTIRVLPRGNWMDDSGEIVLPGTPAVLPGPASSEDGERLNRLDLARWIVAPENPLTARALVNRLWKLYFGEGLSRTMDDLGSQGEWPSHPELLDWLAGRLIDSGWDVKGLVRTIVTSGTYRQSSVASDSIQQHDAYNRWLARQSRFRLDAELVRDSALSISGLLNKEIGGPSVKPYQPPGYWAFLNFPTREWQNDQGMNLYRRGLYTHWQRQYLYPSLLAFDAPSREECTAERVRSNTPLQALVLLNDPAYVEAARSFAELILREGGSTSDDRFDWAFLHGLSRTPRPAEREVLHAQLEKHLAAYRTDRKSATELLSIGARPVPVEFDVAELAAWTNVARTLLNLHATITRN